MKTIESIRGVARNVQHNTVANGSWIEHVAVFELAGRAVSIQNENQLHIAEGNEILVAGIRDRDGIVRGLSYRNVTTGAAGHVWSGKRRAGLWYLLGTGLLGLPLGIGILFLGGWLFQLAKSRAPRKARKLLAAVATA